MSARFKHHCHGNGRFRMVRLIDLAQKEWVTWLQANVHSKFPATTSFRAIRTNWPLRLFHHCWQVPLSRPTVCLYLRPTTTQSAFSCKAIYYTVCLQLQATVLLHSLPYIKANYYTVCLHFQANYYTVCLQLKTFAFIFRPTTTQCAFN